MKSKFVKKLLTFMSCVMAVCGLLCFTSCAADTDSGSDGGNTDKLVLDFNGGKMFNYKSAEFSIEEITPYVGMPIDNALAALGINITNIKKEGFYLHGWTLKKNAETCLQNLPPYGTLYAKWGTEPGKEENVPLTLTLDFNGGKVEGDSSKYFDNSKIANYAGRSIDEVLSGLGITNPTKEDYVFIGWTDNLTTANEVTTLPTSGNVILFAMWRFNGISNPLTLTLDFNGGTSGSNSRLVINDDVIAEYKGMPIANYFAGSNKPLPTKEGYTLVGWSTTQSGAATITNIPLEGTITYYAVWEEVVPKKLTFTWDAGKGFFYDYVKDEFIKTISVEFDAGATAYEIQELLMEKHMDHINPMYCFEEDGIEYSYKEDGIYYIIEKATDNKGNVVMNVWGDDTSTSMSPNQKIYEDITYYFSYVKVVKITYKLEGGYVIEYDHESDKEIKITDDIKGCGVEGYKVFSVNDPERDGYVFMGWTRTKDGDDFVTKVPSEEITVYAKWELPKECTLTINAGEYSQLFDADGNSLGKEIELTFISGKSVEDVLRENNIDYDEIVNKFEIEDAFYNILKDSEGGGYASHVILSKSVTLYPTPMWITSYSNVGILKYYDFVTDGFYNEKAEPVYVQTYDKDTFKGRLYYTPHVEGYIFAGWTYTLGGNDYVNLDDNIPAGVTTTVYAKWIPESEIKPIYEYSADNSKITFTFVPSNFGYDWDSDEFHEVQLMSEAVGWDTKEKRLMSKDSNGNYTVTTDYNGVAYQKYAYYPGFQFYIYEEEAWLGPDKYEMPLNEDEIIYGITPNFKLELASSCLTLDLNGGNIEGKDLYSNFEVDEYINSVSMEYFRQLQNLSMPVNDGYVFAGWTYTRDGDDYVDYVPGGVNVLYAKWIKPTTETITLMAGGLDGFYDASGNYLGNEISFTFEVGITLEGLLKQNNIYYDNMIKSGRTNNQGVYFENFIGSDGNVYDASKILTSSVVLNARYSVLGIVTFDLNGGQFKAGSENITLGFNFPYWLDWYEKPTKEGYKFIGWTLTKDGDDFINYVEKPIPNGIVYAKWQDPLKLFDNGDLTGDFAVVESELKDGTIGWVLDDSKGLPLTYEGEGVYSATFTYYDYMCGWGGGNGKCQFKIRSVAGSWQGASYGVADYLDQPEVDVAEVLCGSNNAANVTVNLEDGVTYKVIFRCASDGNVYVKVNTVK